MPPECLLHGLKPQLMDNTARQSSLTQIQSDWMWPERGVFLIGHDHVFHWWRPDWAHKDPNEQEVKLAALQACRASAWKVPGVCWVLQVRDYTQILTANNLTYLNLSRYIWSSGYKVLVLWCACKHSQIKQLVLRNLLTDFPAKKRERWEDQ